MAKKAHHIDMTAHHLRTARNAVRFVSCHPVGLEHLLTATAAVARARVHVAALTETDRPGRLPRKLWGAVGRTEREVARAQRDFRKCLVK